MPVMLPPAEYAARMKEQYGYTELDGFLAEEDTEDAYDWCVEGLLEYGDRLIVTGPEGGGKSTLLHQIAMQVASDIHPFTGKNSIGDRGVLVIDAENGDRSLRRRFRALRETAGAQYTEESGGLYIASRPEGVDLLDPSDVEWLNNLYDRVCPDLVIAGPLYRLASGDPVKEETARGVAAVLDRLRTQSKSGVNAAIILEAHTPHAESARTKRPSRPYGASYWVRWPEFGIHLAPDGKLEHWRGPRDEREWPTKLKRGEPWPWMVDDSASEATEEWHGPTHCMTAVAELMADLEATGNGERSGRQIIDLLKVHGHGFRDTTVRQACERLALDGRLEGRTGPRSGRYFRSVKAALMSPNGNTPSELVEQW